MRCRPKRWCTSVFSAASRALPPMHQRNTFCIRVLSVSKTLVRTQLRIQVQDRCWSYNAILPSRPGLVSPLRLPLVLTSIARSSQDMLLCFPNTHCTITQCHTTISHEASTWGYVGCHTSGGYAQLGRMPPLLSGYTSFFISTHPASILLLKHWNLSNAEVNMKLMCRYLALNILNKMIS